MSDQEEKNVTQEEEAPILSDSNKATIASVLAYFWVLFFLPLVMCPDSKFGRYHANQGLCLLLFGVICGIVSGILSAMTSVLPVFGIVAAVVGAVLSLINLAFLIYGIYNVATGKCKPLPIIGVFNFIK